jgi:hypothetical protein
MNVYLGYLANYLANSKLQGIAKLLNSFRNMRVTLNTLQFSKSTVETSNGPLHGLRLMSVATSGERLRDARIAAPSGLEDCKVMQGARYRDVFISVVNQLRLPCNFRSSRCGQQLTAILRPVAPERRGRRASGNSGRAAHGSQDRFC